MGKKPQVDRLIIPERSQRVKAGLIAAHKKGRRGGRPKSLTPEKLKKLKFLIKSNDFSVTEICAMTEITRSVYYRAINDQLLK